MTRADMRVEIQHCGFMAETAMRLRAYWLLHGDVQSAAQQEAVASEFSERAFRWSRRLALDARFPATGA